MGHEQTSAPALSPVQLGETVAGKYLIERFIGVGGMGVVVAARHIHVQHRVALKFLAVELTHDGASATRFLREAQAVGAIRCEHVARVMDVGQTDTGVPFLVMEYLEGMDLGRVLEQRGALPEATAVSYVLQALVALSEAHALGIVHRDLKPSNLFLTEQPDGSMLVKVLDFGISKVHAPEGSTAPNLTITGGLLGSPLYMSPEQIRSAKLVDTRSDIWSLGVILHELVTGRPPFSGDQVSGVLASIIADAPASVRSLRSELSPVLEQVVTRCLNKDPGLRFETVAELAQELAPIAGADDQARIRRIVQTMRRAKGGEVPATDATVASVVLAHSAPGSPPSVVATAEGWTQPRGERDRRALWRPVLAVLVVLGAGGVWLSGKGRHLADTSVAEPEAHSAAAPAEPLAAASEKPAGETNTRAPALSPDPPRATPVVSAPEPSAAPKAATPDAAKVAHTKAPVHAKVKPAPQARPKPTGPRDPSELIDDRR